MRDPEGEEICCHLESSGVGAGREMDALTSLKGEE